MASGVGGLFVILASLLALAVAVDRGWLGPAARVCLGLVAGTGAWLGGTVLRFRGHRLVSSALAGAGLGVIYGVLWAAHGLYHFVPRIPTVSLMVAVTAVALLSAVRWRDRFMAHLGLVGGLLTPVLLSTGRNEPVPLFGYLVLLGVGAVVAASRRGWFDLVITAAIGTTALFVSWALSWHHPDQVAVGLAGALVLSLPFAFAAARRQTPRAVAQAATAATLVLSGLVIFWVVPVDSLFVDPRTGVLVVRNMQTAAWFVGGAVMVVGLCAQVVSLRRGWWAVGALASAMAGLLSVLAATTWSIQVSTPPLALALMALGPLAVGVLFLYGPADDRRTLGGALLPLLAGLAALGSLWGRVYASPGQGDQHIEGVALMLSALVLLGSTGALRTRHPAWLVASFIGVTGATWTAADLIDAAGSAGVAAPTLLACAVFLPMPALARRFSRAPAVPVFVGAMAGPAFFWPLYCAWEAAWGDRVIGLLPLLLGAVALLTAVLLVRARQVSRGDLVLAVFVGVALMGLSTAIPLQLDHQWLTLAWAVQGAALALLSRRLTHPLVRAAAVALGVLVAVRLLGNPAALSYGDATGLPIMNWTLYTWGVPAVCLGLTARWLSVDQSSPSHVPAFVPPLLRVLGVLVGFALVNVEVSHAFQDSGTLELGGQGVVQGMVRSLTWAAYGIAILVTGLSIKLRHVRLVGFALVLLATAKVFAVDLWALSGFARVGSVLGLGVPLLVSAFLFERLVLRADPLSHDPLPHDPKAP
ncbi:MAG: DUF2339 domain-containing protein [Oligoflexia bacterium]|nr:DUF2339 domain-containing protein [Oligoflexia bacterium]